MRLSDNKELIASFIPNFSFFILNLRIKKLKFGIFNLKLNMIKFPYCHIYIWEVYHIFCRFDKVIYIIKT